MGGMDSDLVRSLRNLRDDRRLPDDRISVLIKAIKAGRITELACQMPICSCPEGRDFFTRRTEPRNGPWAPSADRWPVPGRDGGVYRADNVRLAHKFCNQAEGGRVGGPRGRGVPHVLSPEGRAALVANGRRLGALAATPEGRERSRLNGLRTGPANGRRRGAQMAAYVATPEGRAAFLRAMRSGRPQTPEQLAANARKANCGRWSLGRGRPCVCGTHP